MIGTKLAHYEITGHLGSGGMGDVYQATDLKLKRSVAIKFLPAEFASDAERLSRFRREAQLLASLNHPNVAHIYGLEEFGDKRCIVMELVEGETVQARLKRGPIPIDEALVIAKQICEALEAAHEKGVVHRDLKPGNVMLNGEGKVKVLDFGLAKAIQEQQEADLSNSPTMMSGGSIPGVILGTAAYMSPEQAKGRKIDKRTDIFAFGCVLYEMLTGRQAFDGDDVSEILARVLEREPDWTLLPANAPPRIRELLQVCLEKNTKSRLDSAAAVRIDIEQVQKHPRTPTRPATRTSRWPWAVAAVFALAAVLAGLFVKENRSAPPTRAYLCSGSVDECFFDLPQLSPDGRSLVYDVGLGSNVWIRSLDSTSVRAIPNTEGGFNAFWSPDGTSIGFSTDTKLKTIPISGGPARNVADVSAPRGGSWSQTGQIVYSPRPGPLFKVSSDGGSPEAVTTVKNPSEIDEFPQFLPDGRHFLYTIVDHIEPARSGLYVGSIDGSPPKQVLDRFRTGVYAPPGFLLYVDNGNLWAAPFDAARMVLTGKASAIGEDIEFNPAVLIANLSAASNGALIYGVGGRSLTGELAWFNRQGMRVGEVGPVDVYGGFALSPDEKTLAADRLNMDTRTADIWLFGLERGVSTRLTFSPTDNTGPVWLNNNELLFTSRAGQPALLRKPVAGGTDETHVADVRFRGVLSPDGESLLHTGNAASGKPGIYLFSLKTKEDKLYFAEPSNARHGEFSPDGRYVAYDSDKSGRYEIYVRNFPESSQEIPISTGGGIEPHWSRDGKELFYLTPEGTLMSEELIRAGAKIQFKAPVALFKVKLGGGPRYILNYYAVSKDGRFLFNTAPNVVRNAVLVTNWTGLLNRN